MQNLNQFSQLAIEMDLYVRLLVLGVVLPIVAYVLVKISTARG